MASTMAMSAVSTAGRSDARIKTRKVARGHHFAGRQSPMAPMRSGVCTRAAQAPVQRASPIDYRELWVSLFRFLQSRVKGYGESYLQGNWAPVKKEIHDTSLVVEGQVPMELDGWYMRTGPNPQFEPHGGYNWFADGDAMIHAVVFGDGQAKSYANHWVRTFKFQSEREAGQNMYLRLGEQKGLLGLVLTIMHRKLDMFPKGPAFQTGNLGMAGIIVHNDKVLTLHENNLPYQLRLQRDGTVESVAAYNFGGQIQHAFTSHPKLDWHTGEMISFGNSLEKAPYVAFNIVKRNGEVTEDIPIDVKGPLWMHDFAITENYAVFMEHNVVLDLKAMVRDHKVPFVTDNSRPGRVGLLSRKDPTKPVAWFETEPFVNLHVANAWEEGDLVHAVICRCKEMDLSMASESQAKKDDPAILTRYTINTVTGEVSTTKLIEDYGVELPVVAPQVVGRANSRYTYAVIQAGMKFNGIVKADMHAGRNEAVVARIDFDPGCFGGEVAFVPRDSAALARGEAADDDGFLLGFITDEATMQSYCQVHDAKTMSPEPLCRVKLPQRIPYGFHGAYFERWQLGL